MKDYQKMMAEVDELLVLRRKQDALFDELRRSLIHKALDSPQRLWALKWQLARLVGDRPIRDHHDRRVMEARRLKDEIRKEAGRHEGGSQKDV